MTPAAEGLVLGTTVERYRIEAVLGEGGMARVYRVTHTILGTTHALKVVTLPGRQFRARLVQEGRAQASLQHPNIVGVTDVLELADSVGLVLEYVPGTSLDDLIARRPLTIDQVDRLADGILRGVAYAHDHGLVHRDLKPANVLLRVEGRTVTAKVADFGLVKLMDAEPSAGATRSGVMMGTPRYMAPEQIESARDVDHRADVFALGAILYELATGKVAFAPDSHILLRILGAIQTGTYTPVRSLRAEAPDRWIDAIGAALQVDPAARPSSVAELRARWFGREDVSEDAGWVPPDAPSELTDERGLGSQTLAPTRPQASSNARTEPTPAPPEPQARPLAYGLALGAVGFVGTLAVGLVLVGLLWLSAPPPAPEVREPQPTVVVAPAPTPPPDPVAPAPLPVVPQEKPSRPAPPRPAPAPPFVPPVPSGGEGRGEGEPGAGTPAPAPAQRPPSVARFSISGARGYLRCAGVDHDPGPVPPGTCAVLAWFDEQPVTVRRDLQVPAGAEVRVTCRPAFRLCDVEVL